MNVSAKRLDFAGVFQPLQINQLLLQEFTGLALHVEIYGEKGEKSHFSVPKHQGKRVGKGGQLRHITSEGGQSLQYKNIKATFKAWIVWFGANIIG
ncbi:hypothetical protein DUI87_14302 [Hirundo rustica rustica]|uniref:Uncharacterized protein n=1 Tax=Hirundo rustica rustica TaxID=333673 RepID=A0A3M0KDH8_HIRRU|nr:hypothetical protein DUI87_14302 [Hirundo rustica rustica]